MYNEDRFMFSCMFPTRMKTTPYYYTGNQENDSYPPQHSWRPELALTVAREEVAVAFLPEVNRITGIEHTLVLVKENT